MVAPQVPRSRSVGEAVFDDQAHRQMYDPSRVVAVGVGQIGEVGVEILAAPRTTMLGILDHQFDGMILCQIPQIVQPALVYPVPIGGVRTPRTAPALEVAGTAQDSGRRQILDARYPLGWIGTVVARPGHAGVSQKNPLGVTSSNPHVIIR
jgi:hypothetical protein